MKKLTLFLLSLALSAAAYGQNINAASCSLSDLNTAINSITQATAVITVAGSQTCHWSTAQTSTIPSVNTNLTIQMGTTVNCTGTPATSGYACTPSDSTVIVDDYASAYPSPWVINMSANSICPLSCFFRMTGFTVQIGTGVALDNGIFTFNGPNDNFRLDHYHFDGGNNVIMGRLFGGFRGVMDHFLCANGGQCIIFSNNNNDSIGYGDGSWTAATGFGTSDFMFMEDFVSTGGGLLQDCDTGGKFVVRYGNVLNTSTGSAILHTHGTKSPAGRGRGCRAYEAYHLYVQGPSSPADAFMSSAGGPSLVHDVTIAGGFNNMAGVQAPRNDKEECETANPNGWGFCGNNIPSGCPTPANSNWDGNTNSTGYPCLDGVGRGQGTQSLNGQNFPNALNSTTGTIAWPHEMLEPIYYFNNNRGSSNEMLTLDLSTQNNRDVFYDCSAQNGTNGSQVLPVGGTTCNGTFTGAYGTGSGLAANRPSTCTPGPGGTYGTSPTGSYGVAYFATDTNILSICTATNTWGTTLNPDYTYPHPLDGGVTTYSLTASTVGPGTLSGTNCSNGTYPAATTITCNETPNAGDYFTGWSGGTCSGTATSCVFNLNFNATVTANFSSTLPPQISLDNHCTQDNGASFSNVVSCAMTVTAGDGITCELTYSDPYTFSSLVDNLNSGGYLAGIAVHHNTTQGQWYGIYYKPNAQGGSTTITLTLSTGSSYSYSGMSCQAWKTSASGSFTIDSPFSQLQDATATANPTTGSNKTPAAGNEVVVSAVGMSTKTPTAGSNYIIIDPLPSELVFPQYWTQTTATSTNAPYTAASDNWSDLMSAFSFTNVVAAPTGTGQITFTGQASAN